MKTIKDVLFKLLKKIININMPSKLIIIILGCLLYGNIIPLELKRIIYAISLSIKEILIFILPFIIFSYLFSCILSLKKGAGLFIISLLLSICFSNFLSVLIGYEVASLYVQKMNGLNSNIFIGETIKPYWILSLPKTLPNNFALLLGVILGWIFSFFDLKIIEKIATKLKNQSDLFLQKIFLPIVPIFITGFILNLQHSGLLFSIIKQYGPIFLIIGIVSYIYIAFLFAIASNFNLKKWISYIKNSFPSIITGFSTLSSAASLPLILKFGEKYSYNKKIIQAIVPAIVNVHLIGDSIGIPVMALSVMLTFGKALPDFNTFLIFSGYFIIQKFAVAGVPGGGILVMLPILESILGFNSSMLSLITAIYIMLDAITSSANVFGNGAFAILFTKIFKNICN